MKTSSIKVLHLSTFDTEGGAARAMMRLHEALLEIKIGSRVYVKKKLSAATTVDSGASNSLFLKYWAILSPYLDRLPKFFYLKRKGTPFTISWIPSLSLKYGLKKNPEVVHVHWLGLGFVALRDLVKISQPIVWTLHDSWLFTGGCHIVGECNRFEKHCGRCPQLGNTFGALNDLSWKIITQKKQQIIKKQLTIVAPSRWMAAKAQSSSLLSGYKIAVIPNGVNTDLYHPLEKFAVRKRLNLPIDKQIILFGAMSAVSDPNKGFEKLVAALKIVAARIDSTRVELVVFGSDRPKDEVSFNFNVTYLGKISEESKLVAIYSAADIMCVPSIQESFGQTALEAMACGTPVIAFRSSGLDDLIEHEKTGYLVTAYSEIDYAGAIINLLTDTNLRLKMSSESRSRALLRFNIQDVAKQYLKLYNSL